MLKPTRNNIVVKPDAQEEKTKSGLFIPQTRLGANNNSELVKAEVIAVGPGYYTDKGVLVEPDVKVGDRVLFGGRNYSGTKFEEDGVEYRLLKEVDILMKIEAEDA